LTIHSRDRIDVSDRRPNPVKCPSKSERSKNMAFYVVCSNSLCRFSAQDKEHNIKHCPYCGSEVLRNCPECGFPLQHKGQSYCVQCKASISIDPEEREKD